MSVGATSAGAGSAAAGGAVAGAGGATGAGAGGAATGGAGANGAASAGASNPSGAVSNTGAPSGNGTGATAGPDWLSGISDDLKGWAQTRGWKSPSELLDSHRNLEKLRGVPESQLLAIPRSDDAAGMEAVFNKLGRPANPDGYGLVTPKEGGNADFTKWAATEFHKLGLTADQGKKMMEAWEGRLGANRTQAKEAAAAKGLQEINALKTEWGAAYDQEVARSQRAAREFGVDVKALNAIENALGTQATMKFFNAIGKKIGDPGFIAGSTTGDPSGGPMTPAQAREQIKVLQSDPGFVKKYTAGDAVSRSTMERLHKYANPEST